MCALGVLASWCQDVSQERDLCFMTWDTRYVDIIRDTCPVMWTLGVLTSWRQHVSHEHLVSFDMSDTFMSDDVSLMNVWHIHEWVTHSCRSWMSDTFMNVWHIHECVTHSWMSDTFMSDTHIHESDTTHVDIILHLTWQIQKWHIPPNEGEIALWPSTNGLIPDF